MSEFFLDLDLDLLFSVSKRQTTGEYDLEDNGVASIPLDSATFCRVLQYVCDYDPAHNPHRLRLVCRRWNSQLVRPPSEVLWQCIQLPPMFRQSILSMASGKPSKQSWKPVIETIERHVQHSGTGPLSVDLCLTRHSTREAEALGNAQNLHRHAVMQVVLGKERCNADRIRHFSVASGDLHSLASAGTFNGATPTPIQSMQSLESLQMIHVRPSEFFGQDAGDTDFRPRFPKLRSLQYIGEPTACTELNLSILSALSSLSLRGIAADAIEKLVTNAPQLEELNIKTYFSPAQVKVTHAKLELFSIKYSYKRATGDPYRGASLHINAPKLKYIRFSQSGSENPIALSFEPGSTTKVEHLLTGNHPVRGLDLPEDLKNFPALVSLTGWIELSVGGLTEFKDQLRDDENWGTMCPKLAFVRWEGYHGDHPSDNDPLREWGRRILAVRRRRLIGGE